MASSDPRKELIEVLLKEYEIMRTEIRLYISKFYLALTAILAIVTAGVFKTSGERDDFVYVWIPLLIAGIIGFMALVTFFVNKNAGYIQLIEHRIDRLFDTQTKGAKRLPSEDSHLAPLLWESYYAGIALERDRGRQFKGLFATPTFAISIPGAIGMLLILKNGYVALATTSVFFGVLYLVMSILMIGVAAFSFWYTNTRLRERVREINKELLARHERF